jgi:hypothetical protein
MMEGDAMATMREPQILKPCNSVINLSSSISNGQIGQNQTMGVLLGNPKQNAKRKSGKVSYFGTKAPPTFKIGQQNNS